ncbi:MAG TPA: LTA synthase family protein [Gammaproteobacteria bacterium]|nr:LTA synthase family protein [Gammaproteobacteria bacterium]
MSAAHAEIRQGGRHCALGLLGAIALAYATLTRLILMAGTWRAADLDPAAALRVLGVGAYYDLVVCLYAALPLLVWTLLPARAWRSPLNRWCWHACAFGAIYVFGFVAVAEIAFWQEFRVRFNFIAVDYLVYTHEVLANIWQSYRVVWVLLGNLGLTTCVHRWLAPHLNRALASASTQRRGHAGLVLGAVLLATGFATDSGDGPRDWFDNVYRQELASNGPYQFFGAFRRNEIDYAQFYATRPTDDVARTMRAELDEPAAVGLEGRGRDLRRRIDNPAQPRRLNVVLIMVESLSAEFMAHFSDAYRWTPALDRLVASALVFDRFYATGTRTDRGLEAVTLSVPPTPGRSIVKRLGRESGYWSLGNVLRAAGYDVSFVYGGRGYFDNMNAFFSGNGYRVVDQSAVPAADIGFENAWGMADEDLYRQATKLADAAHARGQAFFMHLMTTSNHRPYTFPDGRITLPSGSGRPGAVRYTDWAIGHFLDGARRAPWFDDTIFVILGDHCASSAGKVDLPARRYHVPLLIYSPAHVPPGHVDTVASQIDVAPTLLALLGIDYDSTAFGRDILRMPPEAGRALIANYQYLGLLAHDEVTVLGPHRRISRHPAVAARDNSSIAADDADAARAIAYYQTASEAYRHGLLAWRTPAASLATTTR